MYAQLEDTVSSVYFPFSTETASFMNGCHKGPDSPVPSGAHKWALINFLSKRDSDLMGERVRREEPMEYFLHPPVWLKSFKQS